jgi:hypothetical protein
MFILSAARCPAASSLPSPCLRACPPPARHRLAQAWQAGHPLAALPCCRLSSVIRPLVFRYPLYESNSFYDFYDFYGF